jgi:hypothetical protein
MKKTLVISAFVMGALSAYSQGTVFYADRQSDIAIHIFAPQLATPSVEVQGDQGLANGNATGGVGSDVYEQTAVNGFTGPAVGVLVTGGSTVYTGGAIGNTLSGSATPAGSFNYNNGSDYTVQLYAAPGFNVALSALSAVSQYVTTIATSSANGGAFKSITVSSDPGIDPPSGTANGNATIALYAWYNGNGNPATGLTLAQAQAAGDPWGVSLTDNLAGLGNVGSPTPNQTPDMLGLESFSLVTTPEPSTIALGVIGASTLLFRRRK